jgi:hypothetical protein
MSQLGLIWLLIAAPILAIARDVVKYLGGRLDDPPRPAGVIPGERVTATQAVAAALPSVYRARPARAAIASTLAPLAAPVVAASAAAAAGGAAVADNLRGQR